MASDPQATALEAPSEALTERQEAFCRAYAARPVAGKAARLAGYPPATAREQASRLLKDPLVIRRIHDLRDLRGVDPQARRSRIIDNIEAIFESAMENGDYDAAIEALTLRARLAGCADGLPGARILRREPDQVENEFRARAHGARQHIAAARLAPRAGGPLGRAVPESRQMPVKPPRKASKSQ